MYADVPDGEPRDAWRVNFYSRKHAEKRFARFFAGLGAGVALLCTVGWSASITRDWPLLFIMPPVGAFLGLIFGYVAWWKMLDLAFSSERYDPATGSRVSGDATAPQ